MPSPISVRLINVSENRTYRIETPQGHKFVLRLNRPGYRTLGQLNAELEWMAQIKSTGLINVPGVLWGKDGCPVQAIQLPQTGTSTTMILFEFVEGNHPNEQTLSNSQFRMLGRVAATLHAQTQGWSRSAELDRNHWNLETILGSGSVWGQWQKAPNMTADVRAILNKAEQFLVQKIRQYHDDHSMYGLIHADMRLANIIINGDSVTLIDFDDCSFSWYMYDYAASVSFIELHPQLSDFKQSWLEGYRSICELASEHEIVLDSLVMLRRLALLAWVGSHMDSDEPKQLAPFFAQETALLAEQYLVDHS